MPNRGSGRRAGRAAHVAVAMVAMLVSGCFHAGPAVKQAMTSAAAIPAGSIETAQRHGAGGTGAPFDLDKPAVERHVAAFQSHRRSFFDRALGRGAKYVPSMVDILAREGLPRELVYLPLIESGYRPDAVSPAGAAGPWQFIPETGRRYGLRIDALVDERRDPIRSTHAAVQYLKDLHDMFGDWELSLAAYNSGEMRVARILANQKVDDFWDMRERGYLPSETREYVPSFLAAVRIATAPESYGFEAPDHEPLHFETVEVEKQVSLRTAADLCGASHSELAELNPALRRGISPSGYALRVPAGKAEPLRVALASYVEPARPMIVARATRSSRNHARMAKSRSRSGRIVKVSETARRLARADRVSRKSVTMATNSRKSSCARVDDARAAKSGARAGARMAKERAGKPEVRSGSRGAPRITVLAKQDTRERTRRGDSVARTRGSASKGGSAGGKGGGVRRTPRRG